MFNQCLIIGSRLAMLYTNTHTYTHKHKHTQRASTCNRHRLDLGSHCLPILALEALEGVEGDEVDEIRMPHTLQKLLELEGHLERLS